MTPAAELLAAEIQSAGPIPFHRFMETALYHPQHGYYRRHRDPFGRQGDFFTAEQIQPVFGILIASRIRKLFREMGEPPHFTVVELGAGRGEMADALSEWRYIPVEIDSGEMPADFTGVVFSNEFFDALPADVAVYRGGAFLNHYVTFDTGRFSWVEAGRVSAEEEHYLGRWFPPPEEGRIYEINLPSLRWIDRIKSNLGSGYVMTIDYGFTRSESVRFPVGTLMSYRRHTALETVLENPGEQDITAHVHFTALDEYGAEHGLEKISFENLAQVLLAAGEPDQFAAALGPEPDLQRRMQLKTLLFGMGEAFRVLLQRKR
jgi:SAM-dependent MidA family methyltransferase